MDDGYKKYSIFYWEVKKGGLTFCTDNFTKKEVELLINVLKNKFNLYCSIHEKKSKDKYRIYYRIYILKKSLPILSTLISEFMLPSMLYKINLDVPPPFFFINKKKGDQQKL